MASGAFLDTNERLTDLQLSNVLEFVSNVPLIEPSKAFRWCLTMQKRRLQKSGSAPANYSWLTNDLQQWSNFPACSLIIIRGGFRSRFQVKDVATNLVQLLQEAGLPVIWALKTIDEDPDNPNQPTVMELLKYLVSQALRLPQTHPKESVMSNACAKFKRATTESEWISILASSLAGIPEVFIVFDVEVLNFANAGLEADFWPSAFNRMFDELASRGCKTRLRVFLVSYGSTVSGVDSVGNISRNWTGTVRAPIESQRRGRRTRARPGKGGNKPSARSWGIDVSRSD